MKRKKHKNYKMGLILITLFLLLSLDSLAYGAGDIFCNHNKMRYDTPDECVPKCKVSLKNPMGGCFLSPQCGSIPNDKTLKSLYDQAIFLRGSVRRPYSYIALVNYIIDKIIDSPDVKSRELNVQIGKFGCSFYIRIIDEPKGGKYPLQINEKSFFQLSPAYFILSIIHELQHLAQFKREDEKNRKIFPADEFFKSDKQGLNSERSLKFLGPFVQAFGELEVSYYETQSPLLKCVTEKEKQEVEWRKGYWDWKVKEAIENIVTTSKHYKNILNGANEWLQSNIWTWGNWLPQNSNWKTYRADSNNYPGDPAKCP